MTIVASIVEGHGEVAALPVLLRRIAQWRTPEIYTEILYPIKVQKDRFLNRPEEFSRTLQLAAAKSGQNGWILALLDADDDCPARKGADILAQAAEVIPHRRIAVVLANREYEAWFIAAAPSLDNCRGFSLRPNDALEDAERPRDAKGWISERIRDGRYHETTDQPAFSAVLDMQLAYRKSRSFRKLCSEWSKNTVVPA